MTSQKTPVQGGAKLAQNSGATEEQIEALREAFEDLRRGDQIGYSQYVDLMTRLDALSASVSAHPADERHDAEEREAESEDHAATVTGDHEKLIAEALDAAEYRVTPDSYYGTETDEEAEAKAQGFNAAMEIVEPYMQQLAALAAPVEVDTAKLAEVINTALNAWEGEEPSEVFVARAIAERLRGEGR